MIETSEKSITSLLSSGGIILSLAMGFGSGLLASARQIKANTAATETLATSTVRPAVSTSALKTPASAQTNIDLSICEIAAITAPSVVKITTEFLVTDSRRQLVISEGASSTAEAAGISSRDCITAMNDTAVATSVEVDSILDVCKFGQIAVFTVYCNHTSFDFNMILAKKQGYCIMKKRCACVIIVAA